MLSVFLVLVLLAVLVALAYCWRAGKLQGVQERVTAAAAQLPNMVAAARLPNMGGGRSRTSPSVSHTLGAPPLQTPRAGLAGNDSAADNFSTAYTPPPSSSM